MRLTGPTWIILGEMLKARAVAQNGELERLVVADLGTGQGLHAEWTTADGGVIAHAVGAGDHGTVVVECAYGDEQVVRATCTRLAKTLDTVEGLYGAGLGP